MIHPEPWDITADIQQSALGVEGRPIYAVRAEALEARGPKTYEHAFQLLDSVIQGELTRLRELKVERDTSAKLDRQEAEARAMFDDSKEAVLALRYESALVRELRQSLAELARKRKEEGQAAKRIEKEAESEPEVVDNHKVKRPRSTRRTAPPNEANGPGRSPKSKTDPNPKTDRQPRKSMTSRTD